MFLSAKATFNDKTNQHTRLLIRMETEIPQDFVRLYKKNAVKVTPIKSGRLRRSIITQATPGRGEVTWRAPYAAAQNAGGHTVTKTIKGPNKRDGGFGIILPGFYAYNNGARGFAFRAFTQTNADLQAMVRQRGFTQ